MGQLQLIFSRVARVVGAGLLIVAAAWSGGAWADDKAAAEKVVNGARLTFADFVADPDMAGFRSRLRRAKGVLIVPTLIKGGLIIGGSGGTGVLFRRDALTGEWSYPAFYTLGSVTLGLQIGGQAAEVILVVGTNRGMDALLSTKVQLGADASIAAGPVGTGTQAATVDILQYARAKGAFGGLTVEGGIVSVRNSLNKAYYGQPLRPVQILVENKGINPQADPLRADLARHARY